LRWRRFSRKLASSSFGHFNVLGSADLLYAFYQGDRTGVGLAPGLQGATYFIPTVLVPLLLITHGLVFRLLLGKERENSTRAVVHHGIDASKEKDDGL